MGNKPTVMEEQILSVIEGRGLTNEKKEIDGYLAKKLDKITLTEKARSSLFYLRLEILKSELTYESVQLDEALEACQFQVLEVQNQIFQDLRYKTNFDTT